MSAVLADRQLTDTERLEMARKAYRLMNAAEPTMRRLRGYLGRWTPGMRDDYDRACRVYHDNKAIFDKIMRGVI